MSHRSAATQPDTPRIETRTIKLDAMNREVPYRSEQEKRLLEQSDRLQRVLNAKAKRLRFG